MRRKPPRRLKRAGSDPAFLRWVRTQPCAVANGRSVCHGVFMCCCEGRIHAHHAGRRPGVAMKAPDDTAIPLCEKHHGSFHAAVGIFYDWTKMERFAWSMRMIAETQSRYRAGTPEVSRGPR